MSTLELQQILLQKIRLIEDDSYLLAINKLIDSSLNENKVFKLNEEQKKLIQKSKQQLKTNKVSGFDEAFADVDKWLGQK